MKQNAKIRIKDIAEMAKVSAGTVDRVLHNRGEVKEETRKKVLKIIEELGYTPNIIAKSLASKKIYRICVLIPEAAQENPYWQKPLDGIGLAKEEIKDFSTNIDTYTYSIDSVPDFEDKFKKVLEINPDGIIFTPHFVGPSRRLVSECKHRDIPVLFLDSNLESEEVLGYFGQDAISSGHLAASLMVYGLPKDSKVLVLKLTKNKATSFHLAKREQGFLDKVNKDLEKHFKTISFEIDVSQKSIADHDLKEVFIAHKDIKGVFVTNSRVHKAAKIIKELGLKDILLVGYDLVDENVKYLEEGIIDFLICQKPEDQGYKSVLALFNYILSKKKVERVNYSPIDVIVKDNLAYYKNI